jgi:hypothetical protein
MFFQNDVIDMIMYMNDDNRGSKVRNERKLNDMIYAFARYFRN